MPYKKLPNLCVEPYCRNNKAKKGNFCHKCIHRKRKKTNPLRYTYDGWICNCRRRGKKNTVTFEDFVYFCKESGYMEGKGIKKTSLQIDRINEADYYHKDNIRAITLKENVLKYHHYAGHNISDENYCPF